MGCGRVFICTAVALSSCWMVGTYVLMPLFSKDEASERLAQLKTAENVASGAAMENSDGFHWEVHLCRWNSAVMHQTAIIMDVFMRDVAPVADEHNIFLLETGCSSVLNFRSLCALESFLGNNLLSTVWLLVTSVTQDDSDALLRHLYLVYPNLRFAALDLNLLFEGTPLEEFYKSPELLESNFVNVHMSDIARLAVVWRYGGFYSDSDVICLKSVFNIKNSLAFESMDSVANAFFHFERSHPFLEQCMNYISTHYKPDEWTSIGPKAVTETLSSKCGIFISDRDFWNTSPECGYVNFLSSPAIQPLHWTEYKRIFKDNIDIPISKLYSDTYVMHLTGSSSNRIPVDVVLDKSFYAEASKEHCPIIYGATTLRNRFI